MRRLLALFHGIPASGRTWHREHGGWTITDHLLASDVEWTNAVYRAVLASIPQPKNRRHRIPDPLVIPRPGTRRKKAKSWIGEWASRMRG